MTCEELAQRLEAWRAGTLPELKARAMEQHAAECVTCYARLDAASRFESMSRRLPLPPVLRQSTLGAVRSARRARTLRRVAVGTTAVAAMAILAIALRPASKSASDLPGATKNLMAIDHARPAFAALDAAESDVQDALLDQPDDPDLTDALARIRTQRDELSRVVSEAGS
jgi:hypothetical protein